MTYLSIKFCEGLRLCKISSHLDLSDWLSAYKAHVGCQEKDDSRII